MDGAQYDLFLMLMDDYELKGHMTQLEAAQRLARHQGETADDYSVEIEACREEQRRRSLEKEGLTPPF